MPDILAKLRRGKAGQGDAEGDKPASDEAANDAKDAVDGSADSKGTAAPPKRQGTRARFGAWLSRPMTSFHLVVACAALLITLGLTMVLSASGVHSYDEDGSPWTIFAKQVLWTFIGLIAFYIALRLPISFMRRMALPAFIVSMVLLVLVLVPGIGHLSNGSRGWFVVAGFSMQPSELAKISFAIWGAHLLATRRMEHAGLKELLFPLVPAAVLALGLILAEPDLGQTVSVCIILLGLLWYAGLSLKIFVTSSLAAVAAAAMFAVSAGYRSDRVRAWLDPDSDLLGIGYQSRQAKYALANGGMFGDGLGQGTAKFNYLPNAHNDFIFAIIGEELGFVGAVGMLCLFGLFAYTGMRIARRSVDPFLRLLTATTTLWVVGQVFINVGYVLGLLPVTGIQLPLISAGGTATATTLLLIGLIANAARHEPEAVAALRAGRDDRMNRILRLPLPVPYSPTTLDSARNRLRSRTDGAAKAGRKPAKPTKPARPTRQARQEPPARQRRTDASKRTRSTAEPDRGRKKTVPADGAARRTRQNGDPRGQQRRDPRRSDRTVRTLEGPRYG
ncbi:putative lipid II flippase FtsW [Mycobacterium sp. CBMA 234]|uniref:putative lipid II flippase FtsW n=1 Tax=Mycolicibacterium sp. CBMA 234 TaxID=1918495 RepID=UPI0012DED869|nr:putative lipid II flippase FtsW [Mycolicibacterium sp. CBMA 234]MUL65365.1 putative lipid II flippase FtsW [Mycolicibacterium sp. CBMA 234]